jgi:2-C-methyl-D-erythritol 4-phosphate cytidylyltransferase
MTKIKAVILLGGQGLRMPIQNVKPKQFFALGNKSIYEYTFETFQKSGLFSEILLVTPKDHYVSGSVIGGRTRQESSFNGIKACGDETDFVLIHDAVRPFVSLDILKRNIEAVLIYNAVNTCVPSADTIVYVENAIISAIPKRSSCMRGQTPQSFSYKLIKEAHEKTSQTDATDDCSLVLELGHKVHVVLGSDENFKITTPHDYLVAQAIISNKL